MLFVTVLTSVIVANAAGSSVPSVILGNKGSAIGACGKIEAACGISFDPTDLDGDLDKMETCCEQKGVPAEKCRDMMSRLQTDFHGSKEDACQEAIELLEAERAAEGSLLEHGARSQGLMRKAGAGEVDSTGSMSFASKTHRRKRTRK
eukprot:TRINITY_DN34053_c0_g1_i1.p2 TRINITY_DN34053_c0_g1~~TRINITY_DN34053_c0_g1_i1.p2  ORF type:complete len:148 (-),score=29.74 TRINITY_DN34053_c0_g1_i1:70-513(-)